MLFRKQKRASISPAASRGYLHHRFSEDLDLFVNDDDRFSLWAERLIQILQKHNWNCQVLLKEARFVRFNTLDGGLAWMDAYNNNPTPKNIKLL